MRTQGMVEAAAKKALEAALLAAHVAQGRVLAAPRAVVRQVLADSFGQA